MSRFSPSVAPIIARPLDFSSVGQAFQNITTRDARQQQLDLMGREQDIRDAQAAQQRDEYNRRIAEVSTAVPADDMANASVSVRPQAPAAIAPVVAPAAAPVVGAPDRGPTSIGAALSDDEDSTGGGWGGARPTSRDAASAPSAMNRSDSDPGTVAKLAARYAGPNGGAPGMAATMVPGTPAAGDAPHDPTERALAGVRAMLPQYQSMVGGQLRTFDPAQEVLRDAAKQTVSQRLANLYRIVDLTNAGYDPKEAARMVEGAKTLTLEERMAQDAPKITQRRDAADGRVGAMDRRTDQYGRLIDERGRHDVVTEGIGQQNANNGTDRAVTGRQNADTRAAAGANKSSQMSVEQTRFIDKQTKSLMTGEPDANGHLAKPLSYDQAVKVAGQRWSARSGKGATTGGAPVADNFTDSELVAAHNSGARTDDAIRAYIAKQRGAAAGGGHDDNDNDE